MLESLLFNYSGPIHNILQGNGILAMFYVLASTLVQIALFIIGMQNGCSWVSWSPFLAIERGHYVYNYTFLLNRTRITIFLKS
jgi:hypothetical protein